MKAVALDFLWPDELAAMLHDGIEFVAVGREPARTRDRHLAGAAVLISTTFDRTLARACPALRLLLCPAAGTERIDRRQLPPGAAFLHGVGHQIPIAEYVLATIIALRRQLFAADRALRRGRWAFGYLRPESFVAEICGSAMGLIGYGSIAQEVVKRARPFGVRCRALTLHPERRGGCDDGIAVGHLQSSAEVDQLVRSVDALVLCCELSPLTRNIIDARRLRLMRPNAVLVNVARGALVDERALYDALRGRKLAGAALDVWYRYPRDGDQRVLPSALPFHKLQNVIMTPHCSGWTQPQKQRKLRFLADAINDYARRQRVALGSPTARVRA